MWNYEDAHRGAPDTLQGSDLDIFWHEWAVFHGHYAVARLPAYLKQIRGAVYSLLLWAGVSVARGAYPPFKWDEKRGRNVRVVDHDRSLWRWLCTRAVALC